MKKNIFRPVEFWKASIMPLPDHAFFELLRTVFGKIKTPFNKQNLVGDLERFLSNGDIQKNIASYIYENDARIIAAVAALNEPTAAELDTFFDGELDNTELHDMVINLEERFILYRFFEEDPNTSRLALNPVLEPVLAPYAVSLSSLFPSFNIDAHNKTGKQNLPLFDDRILAALLSFVSQNETFFIRGDSVRQRILKTAAGLFPDLQLEPVIGGLRFLGLFLADGDTLLPDLVRFAAFGRLDRLERMEYCAAGILCYYDSQGNEISPWLSRAKLRKFASFIHNFYALLEPERQYPPATMRKLVFILGRNNIEINCDMLIKVMEQTGLLVSGSDKCWQKSPPLSEEPMTKKPAAEDAAIGATIGATIAMDSPFTLLMYPEIAYNDAVEIASISHVIETGLNVRFEIDKDAAVSAFNQGISAAAAIELLQRLSGNRIDENLAFTLLDWEKRHREVSLYKGLVLSLSPERRYLAETKPLSKYISAALAPGVYMIRNNMEEKVYTALKRAGITIFARPDSAAGREEDGNTLSGAADSRIYFPRLNDEAPNAEKNRQSRPQKKEDGINISASQASTLIEGFHSIIGKMRLGAEERDELAARINRRLVLCEAQLKDAVVRYEKLEARGLDYAGKTMIAKQAIAMQSPVEASWPGRQKQESVIGIPKALEKTDGESILVIEPLGDTTHIPEDAIHLPLGKISLLRRIKKSIFENNN
jgi:hypothetical protein